MQPVYEQKRESALMSLQYAQISHSAHYLSLFTFRGLERLCLLQNMTAQALGFGLMMMRCCKRYLMKVRANMFVKLSSDAVIACRKL